MGAQKNSGQAFGPEPLLFFFSFDPKISRVRDVHWQGIRGAAVRLLPQAPDNAANEHLGRARRENFSMILAIDEGHNVSPENHTLNNAYELDRLHKIYCVEEIS